MDIKQKVGQMMDAAEFDAAVAFDQCAVVMAKLENGTIMVESFIGEDPEAFDRDAAVKACMLKIADRLMAAETEPVFPLTEEQAKVVVALADNGMKPAEAAKALGCHRNTVHSRIEKIKTATGLDPLSFFGMAKLLLAAKAVLNPEV